MVVNGGGFPVVHSHVCMLSACTTYNMYNMYTDTHT